VQTGDHTRLGRHRMEESQESGANDEVAEESDQVEAGGEGRSCPGDRRDTGRQPQQVQLRCRAGNLRAQDGSAGRDGVPLCFGFLPQTLAPDGDLLDVLLLMDDPTFAGCAVRGRLIGVIEGQQVDGKKKIRNDRLVVVAEETHRYTNIRKLKDLPDKWTEEVEEFFVNYHNLQGKKYQLLGTKGASETRQLIRKARRAAQ
jgi:inorganic pyrophosphatase